MGGFEGDFGGVECDKGGGWSSLAGLPSAFVLQRTQVCTRSNPIVHTHLPAAFHYSSFFSGSEIERWVKKKMGARYHETERSVDKEASKE